MTCNNKIFGEMDVVHNTRAFLDEIANTKYICGSLINKIFIKNNLSNSQ